MRQGTYFSHINTIESDYFYIIHYKAFIFNSKFKNLLLKWRFLYEKKNKKQNQLGMVKVHYIIVKLYNVGFINMFIMEKRKTLKQRKNEQSRDFKKE